MGAFFFFNCPFFFTVYLFVNSEFETDSKKQHRRYFITHEANANVNALLKCSAIARSMFATYQMLMFANMLTPLGHFCCITHVVFIESRVKVLYAFMHSKCSIFNMEACNLDYCHECLLIALHVSV